MLAAPSTGRTETLNGVRIYFEIHGTGEPLLLLHGLSGSARDWLPTAAAWGPDFQLILPDLRGHGRSSILSKPFRHQDAATDMFALFDHLEIGACKGVGVSGGGNVLLHLATRQPERIKAMVLVSATPYFPAPARPIMSQYPDSLPEEQREFLRRRHSGGDPQVRAILESTRSFATSYDDMNFIVQGDRDPLYPVELSVEMAKAIPQSQLWILPNAGHGPVFGEKWPDFQKTAAAFLRG